jgi:hypothetical protein
MIEVDSAFNRSGPRVRGRPACSIIIMLRQSENPLNYRTPILYGSECTIDLITQSLEDLRAEP